MATQSSVSNGSSQRSAAIPAAIAMTNGASGTITNLAGSPRFRSGRARAPGPGPVRFAPLRYRLASP